MGRPKIDNGVINSITLRISDEMMRRIDLICSKRSTKGRAYSRTDYIREVLWDRTEQDLNHEREG